MKPKHTLIASITGTAIILICCFTPLLVILLTAVGLGAIVGYLDYVLLPSLGVFVGLSVFSFIRYRRSQQH